MKKLFILLVVGVLLMGCSNNKVGKKADVDKPDKIAQKDSEDKKKDAESKEEQAENESDTDKVEKATESSQDQENNSSANKSDDKKEVESQNKPSGNSQSTPSGSGGQTNAPSTPPKQETPSQPPVTPPEPTPPINQQSKASQVFSQINEYRKRNGKEPFKWSLQLQSRSESHALQLAQNEALYHSGNAVECITNYDDPYSAWKNSPTHNEILLCNNTEGAVGIYYYNGYYYSVFQCRW